MALGKAFIEVHADTKPFARELASELDKIIRASEKDVKVSANKLGKTIAEDTGDGIRKNRKRIGKGLDDALTDATRNSGGAFSRFAASIVDTIDDGISGLPAELKVILGAALIALLPVAIALGSALAAGIVAGLTLGGLTAIGALIAFQFTEVQDAGQRFVVDLRNMFLDLGKYLAGPVLGAMDLIRERLAGLAPELQGVFARVGDVIIPVVDSVIGALEQFLPGFRNGLASIDKFLIPLQVGFRLIGKAAGEFFETILNNDDAPEALYDLLIFVEDLIQFFTALVDIGLDFYGTLRDIFEFLGIVEESGKDLEKFSKEFGLAEGGANGFRKAIEGTIDPLEQETQAVEDLNKAIKQYETLLNANINNQIAWEQALDDFTASVKENGRTLDITTQAGRNNATALLELANAALRTRQDQIDLTHDVDGAQAAFEKQRAKIYEVARQMGLSQTATENLIGALLAIPPPKPTGITPGSLANLKEFRSVLAAVIGLLPGLGVAGALLGGLNAYASGGIVTSPQVGLVGEAGPEAIIPLNNPARAQQLMAESGLSSMASPNVNVYIGNEQIDAYIDDRVNRRMVFTARSLAYGGREI